jgi:5'-methylthioadenosine phosphorylase
VNYRHGRRHHISPTNINYRANIWALKKAGVGLIIACNACGSLQDELAPGHIVVLDSFIDRSDEGRNDIINNPPSLIFLKDLEARADFL